MGWGEQGAVNCLLRGFRVLWAGAGRNREEQGAATAAQGLVGPGATQPAAAIARRHQGQPVSQPACQPVNPPQQSQTAAVPSWQLPSWRLSSDSGSGPQTTCQQPAAAAGEHPEHRPLAAADNAQQRSVTAWSQQSARTACRWRTRQSKSSSSRMWGSGAFGTGQGFRQTAE